MRQAVILPLRTPVGPYGGVAGSMSRAEHYTTEARRGARGATRLHDRLQRARFTAGGRRHPVAAGMLETAENVRAAFAVPREEQGRLALESHRRAITAGTAGNAPGSERRCRGLHRHQRRRAVRDGERPRPAHRHVIASHTAPAASSCWRRPVRRHERREPREPPSGHRTEPTEGRTS